MKTRKLTVRYMIAAAALAAACVAAADGPAAAPETPAQDSGAGERLAEARALRMVKSALSLFESNEDDRAIGTLEAVSRLYPKSQARFVAALELGRHFLGKRVFDRANAEFVKAGGSENPEVQAEALLLLGRMHAAKGSASDAAMVLRRLAQDHPTSQFANEGYFMLGQLHFEAGRWARAAEAFEMVGTAVPEGASTNEATLVEAGQRVFMHVRDKDLDVLSTLGEKAYVEISSASGDTERAELVKFGRGDGEFLASVRTTPDATQKGDGLLTVHGSDSLVAAYVDANTESGEQNRRIVAQASVASSASLSFLDGAQRQRVHGVFAGQPAFVQLRDFDLDVTDGPDKARIVVKALYRERPEAAPGETRRPPPPPDAPWLTRTETEVEMTETGPRTGVFACRVVPQLMPEGTNAPALPPGEVYVNPDEKLAVVYNDARHLGGDTPVERSAEALVLVGGSTEPQSTVSHSSDAAVQAKKLLIEARLLCKWGDIFREVGLQENADAKADEGLDRIAELFELASRNSLDRSVIEEAYEVRWSLFFVKGSMKDAIATCNALVRRYPDTLLADRAFMQVANAHIKEDTPHSRAAALEVLGAIIRLPKSALKAEAQFRIGEIRETQARETAALRSAKPDFSAAIAAYRICAETYPSSSFAGESYKRIVDYDISIKSYSAAQETLERVFQDYPDAPWLDEMLLKWGVVRHRMGDREGAKEKFRQLLDEYPGGKSAKTAADFLEKLGD